MKKFKVNAEFAGTRADVFLAKQLGYTRSSLERLFDLELVTIKKKAIKPSHKLKVKENVSVDTSLLTAKPGKIELPVVYEDEDVIVINKPAGVLTHSKGALNTEATVASFIKPKITDKNFTGNRAGIVHRLDRATSGVIINAKNETALKWLQKQFSTRKVMKSYIAVVEGSPKESEAKIDAPIGRNPKKPQTFKVMSSGKSAQTQYRVTKSFKKAKNVYSLVELWPFTGRTHQLRIHLAYVGNPVVGDHVYGHESEHLLLHAKALELILPSGEKRNFETEPPDYFKDFAGL